MRYSNLKIVQVVPVLAFGDAIGNETIALKNLMNELGYKTEIYYYSGMDSRLPKKVAKPMRKLRVKPDDIIIYHLATGTQANYDIAHYNCKIIVRYHNITPPEYFEGYDEAARKVCEDGYAGARYLADKVDYVWADSQYNLNDLKKMGYKCPAEVIPIILAMDDYDKKPNVNTVEKYKDGTINFLFTGRVVPNKKLENVIDSFYYYHQYIDTNSRLIFVGNCESTPRYYQKLQHYIEKLGIKKSVVFPGHIRFDEVLAFYEVADAFICLSEHEGFCVPLVEAMKFNVPIVAYNSSAIGETLGGAGILLEDNNPFYVAEWMNLLITDYAMRSQVIDEQRERLQYFMPENVKKQFYESIKKIVTK